MVVKIKGDLQGLAMKSAQSKESKKRLKLPLLPHSYVEQGGHAYLRL